MNKKEWIKIQQDKKDEKRKKRIEKECEIAWQQYYKLGRRTAQKPVRERGDN